MLSINFPNIDPVIINLYGPFAIRWYGLSYFLGFFLGLLWLKFLAKSKLIPLNKSQIDALVPTTLIAGIIGGRVGHFLFYDIDGLLRNPLDLFRLWEGGMAFHGGLIGALIGIYLFSKKHNLHFLESSDSLAKGFPIGLFFGRIANFINQELVGRVTDAPWGVIFPSFGSIPRHPSQIYEAILEGIVLFMILNYVIVTRKKYVMGRASGSFLTFYGICRFVVEFFREIEIMVGPFTMGQILSLPMVFMGLFLFAKKSGYAKAS